MERLLMLALLIAAPALAQDKKISELPDGSPPQATDAIPIARSGSNYRLPFSAFATAFTGGTITTPILASAFDNCATPPYSFTGDATTGLCSTAGGSVHLRSNGTNQLSVDAGGSCVYNPSVADPAGNYERVCMRWNSGLSRFDFFSEKGGTGTARHLRIGTNATGADVQFMSNSAVRWELLSTTGNFQPVSDDAYSVGLTGKALQFIGARRGLAGSKSKNLTTGSPTSVWAVIVPTDDWRDATFEYAAWCSDGTAHILRRGQVYFAAVAEGTTVTCPTPTEVGTPQTASTSGSFTLFTWGCTTGTNTATIELTATCSLTETALSLSFFPHSLSNATLTYTYP